MARSKNPEKTHERILETAQRLFMEKGYEQTSLQDIIDQLGGLTKGAIYHHFKSKEDIMFAVVNRIYEYHDQAWEDVMERHDLNGLEKLKYLIKQSIFSENQNEMLQLSIDFAKNPKMLAYQIQNIFEDAVPFIEPIIRLGMADGSIQTDYPKELTEVVLLLSNLWLSPLVIKATPEEVAQRVKFFRHLLSSIGIEIFDQEMIDRLDEFHEIFNSAQTKENNE